jgi:hypothetical protein
MPPSPAAKNALPSALEATDRQRRAGALLDNQAATAVGLAIGKLLVTHVCPMFVELTIPNREKEDATATVSRVKSVEAAREYTATPMELARDQVAPAFVEMVNSPLLLAAASLMPLAEQATLLRSEM